MILHFQGQYAFLDNFYFTPIHIHGITYPTLTHAFYACKTFIPEERTRILHTPSPREVLSLGRKATARKNWAHQKLSLMKTLLAIKFSKADLQSKLLATQGKVILFGNYFNETYWGIDLRTMKGSNRLGQSLMILREELANIENIAA
jgi:ribA/ribD-fused uncharacterized protein